MGASLSRPLHRHRFLLPFLFLWLTRRIERHLVPRLGAIFILGGLQGVLGWYMVKSGLVDRVDVSQYRLAAHLTLATIIFGAIVWTALGIGDAGRRPPRTACTGRSLALSALVLLQVAAGGFVAGLDAGMGYNTWPLMDGNWIPEGLLIMEPAWRNFFENAMTVQFDHRMIAYVVAIYAAILCLAHAEPRRQGAAAAVDPPDRPRHLDAARRRCPCALGLMHQGGAMIVFPTAVWACMKPSRASPSSGLASADRLFQIGDDVVDILDADRQAHHFGSGARLLQLLGRQLAVGRRGRMDDERARVAEIGEMREQLDVRHRLDARVIATLEAEGEDRAGALRAIFLGELMMLVAGEPGIVHP